jgi:hypothetical protein
LGAQCASTPDGASAAGGACAAIVAAASALAVTVAVAFAAPCAPMRCSLAGATPSSQE